MRSEAESFGPARAGAVPLSAPRIEGRAWDYLKECLDTGWVSSAGPFVDRFERMIAEMIGVRHAVAVTTGTAACHLGLRVAGVGPGDEVLVPTLTFIATANSVHYLGAHCRFVDAEPSTFGMDPEALERFLESECERTASGCHHRASGRRVAACMPVHVFGHPCRIDRIAEICKSWGIALVEDATESLGSTYHGRHMGTFGKLAALSFNGNKIITTGGGGMVVTNDDDAARAARHLSTQAKRDPVAYWHDHVGYNYRMPNINAALGVAQLESLPRFIEDKRRIAGEYAAAVQGAKGLRMLAEPPGARSNQWLQAVRFDDAAHAARQLARLNEAGFQSRPAWAPCHMQPMFPPLAAGPLWIAEELWRTTVNVPSSVGLASSDIRAIADVLSS